MDLQKILDNLNSAQQAAVSAPLGHNLILAGAGSGKTRVLVHRIAYLLGAKQLNPYNILALTFTNKAAQEMRQRTEDLLQMPANDMWIGTFHAIAHRLLRLHFKEAGLSKNFQVLGPAEQLILLEWVATDLDLDTNLYPQKDMQNYIRCIKNGEKFNGKDDAYMRACTQIYERYEAECRRQSLVDLDQLMLAALALLKNHKKLRKHYRQRFRHVLIDEFQDTNKIQYAMLKALTGKKSCLFAVGDDDQLIYAWRGAEVDNIFKLERDFAPLEKMKLEQNYRSSGSILKSANQLIGNNKKRMGKELWTDAGDGAPIEIFSAFNENEEANFVVDCIAAWQQAGKRLQDCAILYRNNAQSRLFEEELLRREVAFSVYGGLRFYDRAEIKDALAYMRLVNNFDDDIAFARIVNTPPREISLKLIGRLRKLARNQQLSMWQVAQLEIDNGTDCQALAGFIGLITSIAAAQPNMAFGEYVQHIIEATSLLDYYQNLRRAKGEVFNLMELVNAAVSFEKLDVGELYGMGVIDAFLTHAILEPSPPVDANLDQVQLMTLHSAKGLEFARVFMVGMEEHLFPSKNSQVSDAKMEEERRLCYVGMTRARQILCLSYAQSRPFYGRRSYNTPSRFIGELPSEYLIELRPKSASGGEFFDRDAPNNLPDASKLSALQLGQKVRHPSLGEGIIAQFAGSGIDARVQVRFDDKASKWLVLRYANLERCL